MVKPRLLHLDDEPEIGTLVEKVARQCGYEAQAVQTGQTFTVAYPVFAPDVVVLDLTLPGVDGVEILAFLARAACRSQILLCSGYQGPTLDSAERLGEAYGLHMAGVLHKPLRTVTLRERLDSLKPERAP